jgi:5-methylcytosine-specific restriction protein A
LGDLVAGALCRQGKRSQYFCPTTGSPLVLGLFVFRKGARSELVDKKMLTREELREKAMLDVGKYTESAKAFYSSLEWRKTKNSYKKQNPLCELCLAEGAEFPTSDVHHITPISQGGAPLEKTNLIALCKRCHGDVHSYAVGVRIDANFLSWLLEEDEEIPDDWYDIEESYSNRCVEIKELIQKAGSMEKSEPDGAINLYYEAVNKLEKLDIILEKDDFVKIYCDRYGMHTYRSIRYPINRLSLMLEKSKRYEECLTVIEKYESLDDKFGLTHADQESIRKRKIRMLKKTGSVG